MKKAKSSFATLVAKSKPIAILGLVAALPLPALADTVVVTARQTNTTFVLTPCPPFCEISAAGTWSGTGSSSKSSAAGDTAGGSTFAPGAVVGVPAVTITPTLGSLGVYSVEVTHISGNASPNVIMSMSATGGSLTTNSTSGFDSTHGINTWYTNGFITNTSLTPSVTYTYVSGTQASSGGRIYADGFRFVLQGLPCQSVGQLATVNGPLAAGQIFVNVPNVATSSTNVTVYTDSGSGSLTAIGSLAVTNATNAVVPVTALVKGQYISATQWSGGQESCQLAAGTGQIVGGGANTSLGFCLDLAEDANLTGPIGAASSSSSTDFYFLGANNRMGGFATAPANPTVLAPSTCWQTVHIDPTSASYFHWQSIISSNPDPNQFAALDALAIAIADTDTGPYDIYIDNLQNGGVLIQGFEGVTNGTVGVGFSLPSNDSTPSGMLLAQPPGAISPNIAAVSTNHSSAGTNSIRVSWQFSSPGDVNWVRLNAINHPQIDLTKPISFDVLLLPVGVTNGDMHIKPIADQTNSVGGTANFSVTVAGTSPFAYQWYDASSNAISGATNSLYSRPALTTNDAGIYTVLVTDGNSCTNSTTASLAVNNAITPVPISITYSNGLVTLNWSGSHTLQSAPVVNGTNSGFTDVPGPILLSPYQVTPSGSATYYRLKN